MYHEGHEVFEELKSLLNSFICALAPHASHASKARRAGLREAYPFISACRSFSYKTGWLWRGYRNRSCHTSLIGCMICQKVCPANKSVVKWIEPGESFNTDETNLILNGVSEEQLPKETLAKLKRLDLMDYYNVLGRNLKALIDKSI